MKTIAILAFLVSSLSVWSQTNDVVVSNQVIVVVTNVVNVTVVNEYDGPTALDFKKISQDEDFARRQAESREVARQRNQEVRDSFKENARRQKEEQDKRDATYEKKRLELEKAKKEWQKSHVGKGY